MKTHSRMVVICGIGCLNLVIGQEWVAAQAPKSTRTYIPDSLIVPDFIPPAPAVVKSVPVLRVDSAITVPAKSSHTLTIIRGEASMLPDLPVPPKEIPTVQRALTPEDLDLIKIERRHNLSIGATVFDHRISLAHWKDPDTGESYEAVCGFDIGLLSGPGGFVHNGESYSLFLMHSDIEISGIRQVLEDYIPDIPDVPEGTIVILKGDPSDLIGTAPITVLKEIIALEKPRLIPYQAARLRYHQAAAAWEKAHPIPPRDETFWFRPHRGSRYLANPKPEAAVK